MNQFKDKKIAVIGEGVEGSASAEFLKNHGAIIEIRDKKQGENYLEGLNKFDLIVRSPGVKINDLRLKIKDESKITSQTKLFFELSPTKNIIGVTGTKGKGTTSTLIYEMLKEERFDAYLGGNIGVPPFEFIEKLTPDSWVVLELSSFQLADFDSSPASTRVSSSTRGWPHIAVMLMVTSEHLDYHKDTMEYVDAKRNILRFQTEGDFAIINRDYPASNESDIHTQGKVYFISREREVDEGCFALGNQIVLRVARGPATHFPPGSAHSRITDSALPGDPSIRVTPRSTISHKPLAISEINVIDTRELQLRGDHNHENACAASLAAYLAGVRLGTITKVLKSFSGLEHRLELIARINDVEYFNDSFSTTPETAIAAIESFKNPEILILGGSSKQSNFEELGRVISEKENIKAIIGIDPEWSRIKEKILKQVQNDKIIMIEGAKDMKTIVTAASKIAQAGDVVLLSPACASFGMFENYKDRGNQFKEEVLKLRELQN